MKKLFSIFAFVHVFAFCAFSQTEIGKSEFKIVEQQGTIVVNPFNKNWEVSLGVGTQAYLGEYSISSFKFKDWWAPTVDLGIQKWASPFFGLGLGINFSPYKGLYGTGDKRAIFYQDDDSFYNGSNLKYAKGSYLNAYVYGSADLSNLIGGYRSDRIFHFIATVGGGVIVPTNKVRYTSVAATFNAGLKGQFYFNKHWGAYVNVRGAIVADDFNGISYTSSNDNGNIPVDGIIGLTVGASYKFGFVNKKDAGTVSAAAAESDAKESMEWVPMTIAMTNTETYKENIQAAKSETVKDVEKKVDAANKVVEKQRDEIQVLEAKVKSYEVQLAVKALNYRQYVNFRIDKSNIDLREKVNVQLAAEVIKSNPAFKFTVVGFADKQTASASYNKQLSRSRAEAVADCLVKEFGVNADQLVVSYEGGVDYMFYDKAYLSRAVFITAVNN